MDHSYFQLQAFVALLVDYEALCHAFCETKLEVFHEVLEVSLVAEVKTPRVKLVDIYAVLDDKGLQPASQAVLAGQMMVVIEVINSLPSLDIPKIYIASLGGPLEIKKPRIHIFVLKPSFFCQSPPEFVISALDYVYFLVVAAAVAFLPGIHIDVFLFVVLLFLLFPAVYVNVIPVFYFGFFGEVDSGQWFALVLEAPELLIGQVVELGPSAILPLTLQQLPNRLLHLRPFHGHDLLDLLPLQQIEVILLAVQQLIQRYQLVPKVDPNYLILGQFRLDADFILGHEDLLRAWSDGSLYVLLLLQLRPIQIFQAILPGHFILAAPQFQPLDEATEL